MVVRYLMVTGLALIAILLVATPADAAFEDVEFTVVVEDGADSMDWVDIQEIAYGEPGDDTVVMRLTTGGAAVGSGVLEVDLFFTAPGGDFRIATYDDGSSNGFDSCALEGAMLYCTISYATLGASVGGVISNNYAISYTGVAHDYAPGGFWVPDGLGGATGDDYTLVGSTVMVDDVAPENITDVEEDFEVFEETLEGESAAIDLAIDEPSEDVYVYYWSSDLQAALLSGEIVVEEGSVILYIEDGEGTVLLEEEYAGDVSLDEAFDAVTPGEWTIALELYGFVGSADLLVESQGEDKPVANGTAADTSDTTTDPADGTDTTEPADLDQAASTEESPGVGIILLAGVAAIALLRRR